MTALLDPMAEILRDRLVVMAVDALTELEGLHKSDEVEAAHERGRYAVAREAFIAFLTTFGQVAEFQAPTVADMIISSARREAAAQN